MPDVVQQVLLAIATSVDGWQDDGNTASFWRWLATVSRNAVIKFMSRERRQPGGRGGRDVLDLLQQVSASSDRDQLNRYEHELIVWAAEQVQSEFIDTSWAAFWATVIEGRSVNEVAAELQISPGSICMSRSRIMVRIKTMIEEVMHRWKLHLPGVMLRCCGNRCRTACPGSRRNDWLRILVSTRRVSRR